MSRFGLFLLAVGGILGLSYLGRKAATPSKPTDPAIPTTPIPPKTEPPGGWEAVMSDQAATASLLECKVNKLASTEDQLRICALSRLFPTVSWESRTGWQHDAWHKMGEYVTQVAAAGWPSLGFAGMRDTAVVFWLMAEQAVRQCMSAGSIDQIKVCAAKSMFPKRGWPATSDSPPPDQQVWSRLDGVIAAQASS